MRIRVNYIFGLSELFIDVVPLESILIVYSWVLENNGRGDIKLEFIDAIKFIHIHSCIL